MQNLNNDEVIELKNIIESKTNMNEQLQEENNMLRDDNQML